MSGNAQRADSPPERRPRVWIFQANPTRYRILDSLREESEELWNLNQHAREVATGDRVLIWISGDEAGIYAIGTVTTPPILTSDTRQGQAYWSDKRDGRRAVARVGVRYDRKLLERPLLKDFIVCDPDLWGLCIVRQPRGTNFPVREEEWNALQAWLEEDTTENDSLITGAPTEE